MVGQTPSIRWVATTAVLCILIIVVFACAIWAPRLPKDALALLVIPAIGSSASLIFCFGSRNINISDRLRMTTKAIIEAKGNVDKVRLGNLTEQLDVFWWRYILNLASITLLILSIPLFACMYVVGSLNHEDSASSLFYFAMGASTAGFALTILDLFLSIPTLLSEKKYAEAYPSARQETENWRIKKIDVVLFCQKQYDEIRFVYRCEIDRPGTKQRPVDYYGRFWNLQLEQFAFYLQGFLDQKTYRYWMESRKKEWDMNEQIGGVHYRDSWEATKSQIGDNDFTRFMELVFRNSTEAGFQYAAGRST